MDGDRRDDGGRPVLRGAEDELVERLEDQRGGRRDDRAPRERGREDLDRLGLVAVQPARDRRRRHAHARADLLVLQTGGRSENDAGAFDQVWQEVALNQLPVVLCMDRAGFVGDDGAVHHGFCDQAFLRPLPGMVLMAPSDEAELNRDRQPRGDRLADARAVFNGKIIVRQDAQKTNAKQTNRALLLSDVNTIRETNNAIFDDIFWVHLAYATAEDGIGCLRGLMREERHYAPVLAGFEAIDVRSNGFLWACRARRV